MRTCHASTIGRLLRVAVFAVAMLAPAGDPPTATAAGSRGIGASTVPQVQAYLESERLLKSFVHGAYRGECSQHDLREARIALESALEVTLGRLEVAFVPGDRQAVDRARAAFRQQIIRSQEWEYFGPVARPEWGWYPDRVTEGEGIALRVEDGVTIVESVTPGVMIMWR